MLNNAQISEKLDRHYKNLKEVIPNIFRCERKIDGQPVGIYYFDCTGQLKNREELEDFQDQLFAKNYFSDEGPIQWNYYLTFILENVEKTYRQDIEENFSYARKFIIKSDELDIFLKYGELPKKSDGFKTEGPLPTWSNLLGKVGLRDICSNIPMKTVVDKFYEVGALPVIDETEVEQVEHTEDQKAIEAIRLVNYRKLHWLENQELSFKPVNLLYGQNGVGKTSLLETLEYY